ncbi:Uncharacterized conserved protein [Plasmopara halstedii]|uniref:Uncharacterized conserved protein n=1 Tax=Plasmopara halstedii TaxID=4781 RepID=A0A0N7L3L1_PLAHL|nr:Uncharacterized conserved protein [Plasmopara halstedii]CEG36179.1 Uncharacterized conserved protein [Plasmopara halstedii]|eukprot:XP_024572548.1 Uncharacterized conserved protein [Plasmopara halstedii]
MTTTAADNALPRAKRLKMLRDAKARKEGVDITSEELGITGTAEVPTSTNDAIQTSEVTQLTTRADEKSEDFVEKMTQAQEDDAKTEDESDDELLNLAPKRANWDIERDIAPMLRKLERRTQHAIVEVLREKLAAEQQEDSSDGDGDEEQEKIAEEDTGIINK